jgi:hypothetical protein
VMFWVLAPCRLVGTRRNPEEHSHHRPSNRSFPSVPSGVFHRGSSNRPAHLPLHTHTHTHVLSQFNQLRFLDTILILSSKVICILTGYIFLKLAWNKPKVQHHYHQNPPLDGTMICRLVLKIQMLVYTGCNVV